MKKEWWSPEKGFFGKFYIRGDDSIEGYLPEARETLKKRTERESKGAIKLLQIRKGRILDVPCGYGRHSLWLARRGFSVTGIDINKKHLQAAKRKANMRNMPVFLRRDMRNIGKCLYGKFDAVINMTLSFGFFSEKDNRKTMEEFSNALKTGGRLLLHTDASKEIIRSGRYKFSETRHLRDGSLLAIKEKYNRKTNRLDGKWTITSNKKETRHYSVRLYSMHEIRRLARLAGFRKVRFFGSFRGEAFRKGSGELILVAQK